MIRGLYLTTLFIFMAPIALAAPSITGASGTVSNGQTITIVGSGFGSKSTAAPLIWDDVESGSFDSNWALTHDLSVNTNNQRHGSSTRNGHLNFRRNVTDGRFTAGNATHQKWFVQYWFKLGNNWDWGSTDFSGNNRFLSNIKVFRLWNPSSINENFVVAINAWANQMEYVVENVPSNNGGKFFSGLTTKMSKGTWHLFQFEFSENSSVNANNGVFRAWFNGELVVEDTSLKTREDFSNLKRPFIIGFSEVWGPAGGESDEAPNDFYIDDVYMDNSWARIEIGDQPTYAACRHREVQIPVSWTGNTIQANVQVGSFANGSQAYLYVVNANGEVNANGLPLTIDGEPGDPLPGNTPPQVSAGPDVEVVFPNPVTLNGTASDDGNPNPPGALSVNWSLVSGPGTVQFSDPFAAQTTAVLSVQGEYVLRLTGNDGSLSVQDDVQVTAKSTSPGAGSDSGQSNNMVRPGRNEKAEIVYDVANDSQVETTLYQRSQKIRVLETVFRTPGRYTVEWDGRDSSGALLPSGIYWLVLDFGSRTERHKVVLIK